MVLSPETWYDGIDSDCARPDYDQDGDGEDPDQYGGDCDDSNANINTTVPDDNGDTDDDCDGSIDEDINPPILMVMALILTMAIVRQRPKIGLQCQ